jgi:hypothetical protein
MSSRNGFFIPHAARTAVPRAMRPAVFIFIERVWLMILGMAGLLPSAPARSADPRIGLPAAGQHSVAAMTAFSFIPVLHCTSTRRFHVRVSRPVPRS